MLESRAVSRAPALSSSLRHTLSGIRNRGALLLGAAWVACAGVPTPGVRAATLRPELKLEARYDDNIQALDHGRDDLVSVIAPGLFAAGAGPILDWRIWARRSIAFYTRAGSPPTSTTDAASLRAETRSRERSVLRVWSELRRSRDDLDPDERSVFVPGKFRSGVGTALLKCAILEASARIGAWDYSRADQSDATTKQLQGSIVPARSRTHDWLVSYRGQDLSVDGRHALVSHAALAGYRRRHSTRIGSHLEAGVVEIDDRDGSPKRRRPAYTAGLTLYGRAGDTPVAEARVERDAATAVAVDARRRVGNGLAAASWRRRLDAEGGYDPHPVLAQRVTLMYADTLRHASVVSVEGGYAWTRSYRAPEAGSRTYRAGIFLETPVRTWVIARLGYDFLRQIDRDRPDPLNFRRSRITLSLTAAMH